MALTILWLEVSDGEQMTLSLLTTLTMIQTIFDFPGFYSLNSRHGMIFKPPSSNKHWQDHIFFIGEQWLLGGESICDRVPNHFGENIEYSTSSLSFFLLRFLL